MSFESGFDKKDEKGSELERAKNADLITLPKGIQGTNCSNCKFVEKDTCEPGLYCTHKKVRQHVAKDMCCAFWDAKGAKRAWQS